MSRKKRRRAQREPRRRPTGEAVGKKEIRQPDPERRLVPFQELPPLYRYAIVLSHGSIFEKVVRWLGLSYDDETETLATSPLGMFFYNQRFLFFALGLVYILALLIAALLTHRPNALPTVVLVTTFWAAAVLITLFLHGRFIRKVGALLQYSSSTDFPPVFYPYVVLDSALVLGLVFVGSWLLHVDLHYFAFLLLANTIVYSACVGAYVGARRTGARVPVLLLIFIAALLIATKGMRNDIFVAFLDIGPVLGMAGVDVMAVAIVSAVRQREQSIMHSQVEMLGRLEETLGGAGIHHLRLDSDDTAKDQFERRLRKALKQLTTDENPFGYRGARIWFVDERFNEGSFLLPGPFHGVRDFVADSGTLRASQELLELKDIHLVRGSRTLTILPEPIRNDRELADESAAYVPVLSNGRLAAVLTFYGLPEDPGVANHQKTFLFSVSAIIADTLVQADVRHSSQAQEAIDTLFHGDALDDVLKRAATVFVKSTRAEGCLIALRSVENASAVRVVAASGFRGVTRDVQFADDAVSLAALQNQLWSAYDGDITSDVKRRLAALHGRPILSCLGIPFLASEGKSGLVLLVNSEGRAPWFSRNDVNLGKRLAHTVGRLVDKFQRIETTERSLELAERRRQEAKRAQLNAEDTALLRQNNIMVITHQLQLPLSSIRASVLRLRRKLQQPDLLRQLEHIQGLVEDSFALCWGTVATFAKEAGTDTSFEIQDVDAMPELKSLAMRMQRTNARDDLRFEFHAEDDFPNIRIDRFVFTSVFYSLLHNAMKYADKNSRVELICGFENAQAAMKLKSLGEPIDPDEKEEIFKMYKRGRVVTDTGRHHAGVGLGLWVARQLLKEVGGTIEVEVHLRLSIFIVRCPVATSGGQS